MGTVNEPAIRTEAQIISLFPDRETLICRGWVLKRMEGRIVVYPLYYKFSDNEYGPEKCGVVGECDLTGDAGKLCVKGKMPDGLLLKNGNGGMEYVMAGETVIGIKRQGLLFLPDRNLPDTGMEDILRFAAAIGIVRILADIPGWEGEGLPEQYGRLGFRKAYLYRCYQKNQEEKSSGKEE